jgi:DNA-binding transcriptional regulator of glucitol operon
VREARYGRELWGWFIALALLLLIAETILSRWGMTGRGGEKQAA